MNSRKRYLVVLGRCSQMFCIVGYSMHKSCISCWIFPAGNGNAGVNFAFPAKHVYLRRFLPQVTPSSFAVTLYIFGSCVICESTRANCLLVSLEPAEKNGEKIIMCAFWKEQHEGETHYSSLQRHQIAASVEFVTKSAQMISPFKPGS